MLHNIIFGIEKVQFTHLIRNCMDRYDRESKECKK